MPTPEETIETIARAPTLNLRIAEIGRVPHIHGTNEHSAIYAAVAKRLYVPRLAPDFAYIHESEFYGKDYFVEAYQATDAATAGFTRVTEDELTSVIAADPRTLLVFRTIMGLAKEEFAHATSLAGQPANLEPLSAGKIDSMERSGTRTSTNQARVAARTLCQIIDGKLFGVPPGDLRSKQAKPDTEEGWKSVRNFAGSGVPFALFLHQRHYGGAFRQLPDATSSKRGNIIEDAVEALFQQHGILHVRTGSNNQGDIEQRFNIRVTPAPDFVVYDQFNMLRAMLECKGTNNGGTARDKAPRFSRLREESIRLGGVPLIAVLGGMGWARVNDTLGPVLRDTQGRVFTLTTLPEMLQIAPFPSLAARAS